MVLLARKEKDLKESVESINSELYSRWASALPQSPRASYVTADVGDYNQVKKAVDDAASKMGGLDLVVHSAGISRPGAETCPNIKYYYQISLLKYCM